MVVIRKLTDNDIQFEANGRIQIRDHPSGGYKGLVMIKRDSCPFCVKAMAASQRLASRYSSMHVIYTIDVQDPACAMSVKTWQPDGVPSFVKVNKLGRVDRGEVQVDYNNEAAFLAVIKRE